MAYKLPLLNGLASVPDVELIGLFGKSHWKASKLDSVESGAKFDYRVLKTIDLYFPYKGRGLHVFWNPGLFKALQRIAPDVIIAGNSNFPNNMAVMRYCRKGNVPYGWHGIGSVYGKDTLLRNLVSPLLKKFFGGAAFGCAFNSVSRNYYIDRGWVKAERVEIVSNIVDTMGIKSEAGHNRVKVEELRAELGLKGKKVVLFVGHMGRAKKIDILVRAFRRLKNERSDVALVLVGDGPERPRLAALADQLGVSREVLFTGAKSWDVDLYYALGDIFVLPGLGGLALSQAMAHGLPVLAAPADGTERDLVENGVSGYLLSDKDNVIEDEIVGLCGRLLSDDVLCRQMQDEASRRVRNQFNIEASVQSVRRILGRVLGEGF